MTTIMTIVSGLPLAGKSHLAINLALEYVRRGRLVALYHELEADSPIERMLSLQAPDLKQRRTGDVPPDAIRRGYQGVDIVSCPEPLSALGPGSADRLASAFAGLEANEAYDDFLIDTSSMPAHTVLGCCMAAGIVTVLVTPEPASRANAYALLRVLQLNGYSGKVCLVINKVSYEADAFEIRRAFIEEVKGTLHLKVHDLGVLVEDNHVRLAQGAGQAVTSCFPDSGYADCLLVIADNVDELQAEGCLPGKDIADFCRLFAGQSGRLLQLPGGARLEPENGEPGPLPDEACEEPKATSLPVSLVQFEGELDELYDAFRELPVPLGTLAADISSLRDRLSSSRDDYEPHEIARCLERGLLQQAAVMLVKAIEPGELDLHHVRFRVRIKNVSSSGQDWLRQGRYLRYEFLLLDLGGAVAGMQELLTGLPHDGNEQSMRANKIYEWLNPAHNGCLSVIVDADSGVRIQVWSVADRRGGKLAGKGRLPEGKAVVAGRDKTLH